MSEKIKDFTKMVIEEATVYAALPADSIHVLSKRLGWSVQKVHSAVCRIRKNAEWSDAAYTIAPVKRGRSSGRYFALLIDRSGKVPKLTAAEGEGAADGMRGTLRETMSKSETLRTSLSVLAQDAPSIIQRRMFDEVSGNIGVVIKKIEKLLALAA